METIAVSDLRINMRTILKEIELGSTINITSRGKVVAKLVPPDSIRIDARNKLKEIGKTAVLHGLISPIDAQ